VIDTERLKKRKTALYNERTSWDARAKLCAQYVLPRAGRFDLSDRNKGENRFGSVYDNTAIKSNRVLAAGMMAGMTSPARPWFRLATPDPALMEFDPVRLWLDKTAKVMRMVFARTGLYRTLHSMYEELGAFGTASAYVCRDFDSLIHSHALTWGEYAIAQDAKGNVNTIAREYEATVEQIAREFGLENCSENVKSAYLRGNYDQWIPITHVVMPRDLRDVKNPNAKNKRWLSVYFESGANDKGKVLRESGYDQFPFLCPRWVTSGGDVYGTGPAHEAMGPIKKLQHMDLRKAQAIDYKTNPPLQMPAGYRTMEVNTLPGGISYIDMSTSGKIQSAFDVQLDIRELGQDIVDARSQVESIFFSDLFLMMANDNRSGVTAREINERHEEKMLMLGPVLERLHNELIEPLIDIVFDAVTQAVTSSGPLLPPAPKELKDMDLKVDFISTLAQAQKQLGLGSIERFSTFTGQMAQLSPDALDKLDADQAIDVYADMLGVDPAIVRSDEAVAEIRAGRQQKQAQQEQMAQMAQMAQPMDQMASAMQKAGATTAEEGTALNTLMQGLQGYS
jgi:hypothetical protein